MITCGYCNVKNDDPCIEECECSDCLENHDSDCLCQGCTDRRCDAAEAMNDLD